MDEAELGKGKYLKHLQRICDFNATLQSLGDTFETSDTVTDPPVLQQMWQMFHSH